MKKILFIILFFNIVSFSFSQNIKHYDEIIDMGYYKAYYCEDIQTSSFVIYKMYKGGGETSRKGLNFKSYKNLPHYDYNKSGYDRGHLVPAEDMAYSEPSLKSTFYYINCVPQHPSMNRGAWRRYETLTRTISQSDSILIICGGCDYNGLIPDKCFKIVYNLKTRRCMFSVIISNDIEMIIIDEPKLKQKLPLTKALQLYNKK